MNKKQEHEIYACMYVGTSVIGFLALYTFIFAFNNDIG